MKPGRSPEDLGEGQIPFETILAGLVSGDASAFVEALAAGPAGDRPKLSRLLRDRDPDRLVASFRSGDERAAVDAILEFDPSKKAAATRRREAEAMASALASRGGGLEVSRRTRRITEALTSMDPARLVSAAGEIAPDAAAIIGAIRRGDNDHAARLFRRRVDPGRMLAADASAIIDAIPGDAARDRLIRAILDAENRDAFLKRLAFSLRGVDSARLAEAMASGDESSIVECLTAPRKVGAKMLPTRDAMAVAGSLPADDIDLMRIAAAVRDSAPPVPLADEQSIDRVIDASRMLDLKSLCQAVSARRNEAWTAIFADILPKVAAAARRKLGLYEGRESGSVAAEVAQSVARTVLRRAGEGLLYDYEIQNDKDLAAILIQIAYRKCSRRIRLRFGFRLSPLEGPDGVAMDLLADADPVVSKLVRQEMSEQVAREIDRLSREFDPIDRVIVREKLAEGQTSTEADIRETLRSELGIDRTERAIRYRWKDNILSPLRERLERWAG